MCLIIGIIGVAVFLILRIYMATTEFGITDQRIIVKTGFIRRNTNEIPLKSLENVNLKQSVLQRLFGYGRLEINGSGGSGLFTHPIQDPVSVRATLAEARIATENALRFRAKPEHISAEHNGV